MTIREEQRDLFTVPTDYILVHCISADFAMGAGIAKEFAKRGVKQELKDGIISHYPVHERIGKCITTVATGWRAEFNLITKEKYWYKPTYSTLKTTLEEMKHLCLTYNVLHLAMPRIGCGLDRLSWDKVKQLIEEVFADTDVEILVCVK